MSKWENWDQVTRGLRQMAYIDEAMPYETDQTGVYIDPATAELVLVTASGCSCWDGDCEVERFKTVAELEYALLEDTSRTYNPTLAGAETLLAELYESLKQG